MFVCLRREGKHVYITWERPKTTMASCINHRMNWENDLSVSNMKRRLPPHGMRTERDSHVYARKKVFLLIRIPSSPSFRSASSSSQNSIWRRRCSLPLLFVVPAELGLFTVWVASCQSKNRRVGRAGERRKTRDKKDAKIVCCREQLIVILPVQRT